MSGGKAVWDILWRNKGIVLFFLIAGLSIVVWSIYVQANDDGIIEGRVVDQNGDGIADAEVLLQKKGYDILHEPIVTTTDNNGYFEYQDIEMLEFVISAEKQGYRSEGERVSYHRYFLKHNFELPVPIQLIEEGTQ